MPILTERESNPRWGFLNGLGAADGGVPPKDQFDGWKSLEAKRAAQIEIRKVMLAADDAINSAARDMPGVWNSLLTVALPPLWLVNLLARDTQARIKQQVKDIQFTWNASKNSLYLPAIASGIVGTESEDGPTSMTPADARKITSLIQRQVSTMQDAVELANKTTNAELLLTGVGKTIEGLIGLFARVNERAKDAFDAFDSLAGAAATFLKWLPVIVVAAVAVPFGINAYLKYKEGGTDAALRFTSESIAAGRARASEAAGKAAAAARRAAAAYASGGATLALQGTRSKRRVARKPRRR